MAQIVQLRVEPAYLNTMLGTIELVVCVYVEIGGCDFCVIFVNQSLGTIESVVCVCMLK